MFSTLKVKIKSIFKTKKIIKVIKLNGVIASGKKNLCLNNNKSLIDEAFNCKNVTAVALLINSPGGSPVQSEILANYIMDLAQQKNIKLISFVEDVAASGGYWISLMSDSIYALSNNSIVGSLGVVYSSFGLEDFIAKIGVKRRVYTAGEKKVSLDIFQSEKDEDVQRLKTLMTEVHNNFKNWVYGRRQNKLNIDEKELFSGEFWLASTAIHMGLIDGVVTSVDSKLKALYGNDVKIQYCSEKKNKLLSLLALKNTNQSFLSSDVINHGANECVEAVFNQITNTIVENKYKI